MPYKDREVYLQYHKEKSKQHYILYPHRYAARDAKQRAKKKGLEYNLDEEYIKEIWPTNNKCPILGIKFKRG